MYLARQHTEKMAESVAETWPATADCATTDCAAFVQSLPGYSELQDRDKQFALNVGATQVGAACQHNLQLYRTLIS